MAKLNKKECDYLGVIHVCKDPGQASEGGINPSWTIVNWLRARNYQVGSEIEPIEGIVNFQRPILSEVAREIDIPTSHTEENEIPVKDHIETILTDHQIEIK